MAFVEVIRRSMRPEEWTDLRFTWLKRGIVRKRWEITDIEIRDARQISEDSFEYYGDSYRPLRKGDMYFTPDGTAFIRGSFTIPEDAKGRRLQFSLHTAAEMLVKIDGKYADGIDPNRDRFPLDPFIEGKSGFSFEIEAYNRSKPDDERNPDAMASRGCRQIFEGAYVVEVDEDVLGLYYDLVILLDIAKSRHFDEDCRQFINTELDKALNYVDFDTYEGASEARDYIDKHIYANKDFRSSGNVALVGHSHLDIAYYWRRIHVVEKNARTILIQLRLMDRYPEFRYCHTQPYTYETLEKYHPDLFAELKKKIASGQFEPVGAMYVEPDCNIPQAESLIRQCLYGQAYYKEKFGFRVDNAWLPDVFGNSWILPQILRKCGVDYFVSNKMSTWNDTNRFPHNNFIWKGLDGTDIYACVPPTHFITWNMPSQIQENWDAYQDKETGGQTLSMFGYGDGGSGVTEEMLEMMKRFDKLSIMPKTEHMRADEFLSRNLKGNDKLEVWDGELYLEMHRGTFTTKSVLKETNRRLEFKLRTAELLSVIRAARGEKYPDEEIRSLYKKLLLNQFHDILPGSHINPVFQDAIADYADIEKRVDNVIAESGDRYFNPLNRRRTEMSFIADERGRCTRKGKKGFFVKSDIDSLSSAVLAMCTDDDASWFEFDGQRARTTFHDVTFMPDGSISRLADPEGNKVLTNGNFNKLHLYKDVPGMYDAWDILPNYKDVEYDLDVVEPLHLAYADHTVAELTCTLATPGGRSTWKSIIRFFRESPAIEVESIVDWDEKHKLMKVMFKSEVLSREIVTDASAGYVRRECHRNTSWQKARFEVCMHKWCDFSEADGGFAVINESKYGMGVENDGFSISLLRSNIRPDILSDIGHHDFCYVIYPHDGSFIEAKINGKALEYNIPLVRSDVENPGWDFGDLYLEAAKLAEDGKSIVIRLSEQDGKRGSIPLSGSGWKLCNMLEDEETALEGRLSYKPFEIITLKHAI